MRVAQLVLRSIRLSHYRFGRVEWLRRYLGYAKPPQFRRSRRSPGLSRPPNSPRTPGTEASANCYASVTDGRNDMRIGISLGGLILLILIIWLLFGR